MKKRILAMILSLSLCVCLLSGISLAAEEDVAEETGELRATITVTVAAAGELVLINQPVLVTDLDEDGVLTVRDALMLTHDTYYKTSVSAENGAETDGTVVPEETDVADHGFAVSNEGFITKLWGIENGGSYGYYVNNMAAMSITDSIKDGDYLAAFTYADLETWSDMYTYFESNTATCEPGAEFKLKLSGAGYDEAWNPVVVAVANAEILINGEKTEFLTDEKGEVTVTFAETGAYTVSAVGEESTLVPPVCVVTVAADAGIPDEESAESAVMPDFTDVSGHWAEDAIRYTVENQYLKGTSDTEFSPDMDVSRAMIVTVLYRMAGEPEVETETRFSDLEEDAWYTDAVLWAAENELVLGYNDAYRPTETLNRQEAALILYRWAEFQGIASDVSADLSEYADADLIADWALEAMCWTCDAGIIGGVSATELAPQQSLTRAQLALMLMRLMEK